MDMLSTTDRTREISARKYRYGLTYGLVAGLAFAVALFGYDGYLLWQHHASFPWIKLSGALLFMLVSGLAGWLAARLEKPLLGLLFWLIAGLLFAVFAVLIPFWLAPRLMSLLDPDLAPMLHYTLYENLPSRGAVLFIWITIFLSITAVIQTPLVEQAVFSTTAFGRISLFLVVCIPMIVAGAISDDVNNLSMREPIINLDNTIQFWLDTRGTEVDARTSREMHLAALRPVETMVSESRQLTVSDYDELVGFVHVAVEFDGQWADCALVFGQLTTCSPLDSP
ncbi:MAG: hypothetical protein AB1564_04730 [Chloroflexota bacterium]